MRARQHLKPDPKQLALNGRVAVVTGGTGAIGTEICRQLLEAGAAVAAVGHPSETDRIPNWRRGLGHLGRGIHVELADLADYDATAIAVAGIEAALGPIDVLVNGAGITRDARLVKMDPQQWRKVIATNLDSVFNATRTVFPGMCARGFGRVVNIASVNGQKGQFGQANYSAAKAGIHGFTMAVAQEGAAHGVTVNTVSPGYIETPMTASIKPQALERVLGQIPVRRLGRPQEVARVVVFLCDEASGYITGANLAVNGGLFMSA
ncbi:MAG: acetoacetyl-CoA reductase [Gammaproteobacteria bacterium]|nr:acetoacetyl-CoA reductase [Gammaproteobacteria bacterium]